MKTTQTNQKVNSLFIKSVIIALITIIEFTNANAQINKSNFDVTLSTTTTGNGHGLMFNPGLIFVSKNSSIALEFNFQKRKGNFAGTELTYEYSIYNGSSTSNIYCNGDVFDVFLFLIARYNTNQLLGESQIKVERKVDHEGSYDYENIKMNTAEAYIGFGVRTKIAKHIKWVNSIGFGGYTTLNNTDILYREQSTLCLTLKTGLLLSF